MPATLTVTVSDAAFARLQQRASEQNTTPEAVLAADLEEPVVPGDSLRRLAGSWSAGAADVGSRHDDHLGDAIADEMRRSP